MLHPWGDQSFGYIGIVDIIKHGCNEERGEQELKCSHEAHDACAFLRAFSEEPDPGVVTIKSMEEARKYIACDKDA